MNAMIPKDYKQNGITQEILKGYSRKTILLTGSSGFIGSSLARAFFDVDCQLRLLDTNSRIEVPKDPVASVKFIKGDITQKNIWKNSLKGVDFLFHLAALEYNRSNFDIYKDLNINALAIINLLEVCRVYNYKTKIIFSSSANLFSLASPLPLNEESKTDPASLWSAHKLLAENYIKVYAVKYGIKAVILRLANVYGPTYNDKAMGSVVINKAISNALAGKDLYLYRNRNSFRDYLYIDDAVRAFLLAGNCKNVLPKYGYYVIGSQEGLTISKAWRMIASEVGRQSKRKIRIKFNRKIKPEPFDYRNFVADSGLFSKTTGWQPLTRLRNGIRLTMASMLPLESDYGTRK